LSTWSQNIISQECKNPKLS